MNFRLLARYLGLLSVSMGALMVPSLSWAIYFSEWQAFAAFLQSMLASIIIGGVLYFLGRNMEDRMFQRESLGLVAIGWLLSAAIAALPFFFRGTFGPVDAYFEAMSGLTTTGATVLVDIEAEDKSILFWRSFTHWLGGMGIIVLFIAVLPYLGAGGKQLFRTEAPGPDPRGLRPRIKDTASILWKIYLALTVMQTALLMIAGMNLYEALCHTFGTLATGGFSTRQASVAAFDSLPIEIIIIAFMGLAGTNFSLFFIMLGGNWRAPFTSTEWRFYVAIMVVSTLLVAGNLFMMAGTVPPQSDAYLLGKANLGFGECVRAAAFQVVSIMTTTGYATEDFDLWPYFSRMLLVMLMFVGGCAGSTGGGMKVIRVLLLIKMAYRRLEHTFRPKTIRAIRINEVVIDDEIQKTVYAFFVLYMGISAFGALAMSLLGLPFETAVTSVVATLNNIGPGLELVGAVRDYTAIPEAGKLLLTFLMAVGRLEVYTMMVLLLPSFWRHS
jgi:trk system potassium uptake protein TrkH